MVDSAVIYKIVSAIFSLACKQPFSLAKASLFKRSRDVGQTSTKDRI